MSETGPGRGGVGGWGGGKRRGVRLTWGWVEEGGGGGKYSYPNQALKKKQKNNYSGVVFVYCHQFISLRYHLSHAEWRREPLQGDKPAIYSLFDRFTETGVCVL